ncbi:receptor-type protein kinase, putative, partial [Bodo saltans]
ISTLTHLQHLDLSACINISDASLQVISTLTQLQHLNLTGCSMIKDLSSIATLTQLKYLDLSLCKKLTDASLRTILSMTQLQHLKLNLSCHVTDTSIHAISALTRLQQLGLSYCNYVTDAGLNAIATLTQLRRLDVSGNDRITDAGLRAISTLTQLQHLDLSGCSSITGVGLHFISQMELQLLNLRGVKITDLSGISTLKHLKHLDLVGCDNITDASLGAISTLTQLQHLNLSRCNNITGAGLCAISTLTELQHLALTDCSNITDAGLSGISTLTQLQHLGLSGCESITDEGLFAISPLTLLQHLDLGQCIKITDAGLHVISSFTWLKHLNLNKCAITHIGLSAILELTQLQYLGLISCRNIKGADIAYHTSERTQLKRLNVIGCCIQRWLNENGAVASVDKCMIQWIEGLWKAALPKDDFVAQFEKYFEFEPYWQHMVLLMKEFGDILPDDENSLELAIDNHFVVKQERESKLFWIAHFSDPVVDFAFHLLHLKKVQPNHNLLLRWLDTYVDPQQPLWPQFLKCFKTKVTKEFILLIFKREFNDEKSDFDGAFQVDLHNHFNALLTQTIQKLKYEPETLSSPVTVERTVSDAVQARWTKRNLWVTKLIHKLDPYDELDSNDNDLGAIYSSEDDDDDDHALLSEALHLPKRSNFVRRQIVIHRVEDEVLKRRQLLPLMASSHQGDDAGFDTLVNCGTYKLLVSDSFMLPAGVDPRYLITSPSNPPQDIQRLGFSAYSSDVKPFINTCEYFAD